MGVIYLKETDPFECCGIPAHVIEVMAEARVEERLPGASRRNWVYREIAMLGADAIPSMDAMAWLENISPR